MPCVLLIRPLCEGSEPEFSEPLGIERLAGYVRSHGVDAEILDRRLYAAERRAGLGAQGATTFWDDVRSLCAGESPQVVGVSLMTRADVADARRILSRMHAYCPQATLVAGGVYVTTATSEARRLLPRDVMLLRGEGEAALLALARGEKVADEFVSPDEWAEPYRPHVERYARLGCAVTLQTSRGCPGTCTFCATPQLPSALRRWRARSARLVVDEMEHVAARLEAAGLPPIFNLVDDDAGPLSRLEEIALELRRRSLHVAWACELRIASLAGQPNLAERMRSLREVGLTRVFVGVESLNPNTLRTWRKHYDVESLPDVLDALRTAGVAVQTGYILWHAGQTVEGALGEARRLHELGIYTHQAAVSRMIVFLGSELGKSHDGLSAFEVLGAREEAFYQAFVERTSALRERWVDAAMREPYVAAKAFLGGDDTEFVALHAQMEDVNERSYRLLGIVAGMPL